MSGKTRGREDREERGTKMIGRMGDCRKFGNEELKLKFHVGRERYNRRNGRKKGRGKEENEEEQENKRVKEKS